MPERPQTPWRVSAKHFLFYFIFNYLFIYCCAGSSFLCEGFLQLRQVGATLHRGAWASHYRSLSCCGAQAPDAQAQQLWLTGLVAPRHVGSSQTRAQTHVPCIGRHIPNHCATREAPSKALLKARWGRGKVGCCKLLGVGILCSCSCPRMSGRDVPVNLPQDKCYSLFRNFLSLYKWTLKGQSLENRLSCIFQAIDNILLQTGTEPAWLSTGNRAQK